MVSPGRSPKLLLTGLPGCGKTTLVRRVVERLVEAVGRLDIAGFYTREIRLAGRRVGFEAVGFGGRSCILAHVDSDTEIRVGRYGVDLAAFEPLVRTELLRPREEVQLFVIDEIGRMECASPLFVSVVRELLAGPVPILATVGQRGGGFMAEVRGRPDVRLVVVSPENRESLLEGLDSAPLVGPSLVRRPSWLPIPLERIPGVGAKLGEFR